MLDFTEFNKLVELLEDIGAEYAVFSTEPRYLGDFYGKKVELCKNGEYVDDAVINKFSHGADKGLLETYILSNCVGFETATEIFDGWERMMMD